jgi:hypothetical protein
MLLLTKSMIAKLSKDLYHFSIKHKGQLAFNVCNLNHVSYYQCNNVKSSSYIIMLPRHLYNVSAIGGDVSLKESIDDKE